MPKNLAIISVLTITVWLSLPSSADAAPLRMGADVGEDIVGPGVKTYRPYHRHVRGDYFRGRPWGPGIHYSCAAFGGPAGYYSQWNPYYCNYTYAGYWGPYGWRW